MFIRLRHINGKVYLILDLIVSISCQTHQVGSTALALLHIADSLFVQLALGQHTDNQRALLDQADGSVFQFTCSVCFRVDIADFLQFQTTFSCFPFMGEVPLQGSETLALYPQSDKVHIRHMLLVC